MSTPIKIDVSAVLDSVGQQKHFNALVRMEPLHRGEEEFGFQTYVEVDVVIESVKRGVLAVQGDASGIISIVCSRCLTDGACTLGVPLRETFCTPLRESEYEEECYPIQGHELDLGPAVEQAFLLALPMQPLCHKDCAGLCVVCGANLNDNLCGHSQDGERVSPFGVLEQFLGGSWEQSEEEDKGGD